MMKPTIHSVIVSAKSFFAGTMLSRISGLLRDIAMAACFGSSPEIGAFMVSYRLSNLFRRLLGEGNLQAGFVPHFIAEKERAPFFYRDVTFSMGILLVIAVVLLECLFGVSKWILSEDWVEIIDLSMIMLPGLFFICLCGLNNSLLQCQKKYFLPAVAPVAFNFIWIGSLFVFPGVRSLGFAVTIAFGVQWLLTFVQAAKILSFKEWIKPQLFSAPFKSLLKPMALGLVGIGAVQLNSALDVVFARLADPQGPAFLWYAIRIQQLPLALFGLALSGALLPPLSRTENRAERGVLLRSALRYGGALMFVCTFGLFALGRVGLNLLYGHGDFSSSDVEKTLLSLCGYGLGLVPSVFILLFAAGFYAEKNYRRPAFASLLSVGLNLFLNGVFVLIFGWGAASIAVATSLSALLNMAILSRKAFQGLELFFIKLILICLIPALITYGLERMGMEPLPRDFLSQLFQFVTLSAVYLGSVLGMFLIFGGPTLFSDFAVVDTVGKVDD